MNSENHIEQIDANVVILDSSSDLKSVPLNKTIIIKPVSSSVMPSLEASPLPSYDYDSIDIYQTHMCAFTVIGTEGQTFEEYEAMYNQQFEPSYPDLLRRTILVEEDVNRIEHEFKSISEHGPPTVLLQDGVSPKTHFIWFLTSLWAAFANANFVTDWELLKQCLTYELFTNTLVTIILALFLALGYMCDVGTLFLTLLFGVLMHLSINLTKTLWRDVKNYFKARQPKRRVQLTPKPSRVREWVMDPFQRMFQDKDDPVI